MEWNSIVDLVHRREPWYKNNGQSILAIALHTRARVSDVCHLGLVVLNLCLILPLMTASINGFDSSVVNGSNYSQLVHVASPKIDCPRVLGLQLLQDWQNYFNQPHGTALGNLRLPDAPDPIDHLTGFMNAAQNIGALIVSRVSLSNTPLPHLMNTATRLGHSDSSLR